MVQKSVSQHTQSEPPSPPPDGNPAPPKPEEGVQLTNAEWAEANDIDMAFHAAMSCDVDEQHQLELLKSVQARYSRFILRVTNRLYPDD